MLLRCRQLGGTVAAISDQVVHARFSAKNDCNGCTPLTVEHVDYHGNTIWIFPRNMLVPAGWRCHVWLHGFGHVAGYEQHLDADTRAIMTPFIDDAAQHDHYEPLDVRSICTKGRA